MEYFFPFSSFAKCREKFSVQYPCLSEFLGQGLWKARVLLRTTIFVLEFESRIVNIHPYSLPAYRGYGMYRHFLHEAVNKDKQNISGMTIHLVNEKYDEGRIIFQAECALDVHDKPEQIAEKVLKLEHKYYSQTIENYINSFVS